MERVRFSHFFFFFISLSSGYIHVSLDGNFNHRYLRSAGEYLFFLNQSTSFLRHMLVQLGLGLRIITKTAKSPVILRSRMKLSTNVRAAIQLGLYKYCESQYGQDATMISSCFLQILTRLEVCTLLLS